VPCLLQFEDARGGAGVRLHVEMGLGGGGPGAPVGSTGCWSLVAHCQCSNIRPRERDEHERERLKRRLLDGVV
jgi:hypothetical protein